MTLSEKEVRTPAPGGLEYAARYTHHYTDGRQVVVINSRCADPADRAWAAEQVANMARIQTACEWPVDACLVTRRTTTEWAPETPITDAQRDGWACIICHRNFAFEAPSVPAGSVMVGGSAWQVFRCSPSCPTPELAEDFTGEAADKLRARLNKDQLDGVACIHCGGTNIAYESMIRAGVLDGGAVWRCKDACTAPDKPVDVVLHPHIKRRAQRGDAVEVWLKAKRDEYSPRTASWFALDSLLDEYRLRADYGTPLDEEIPDGAL